VGGDYHDDIKKLYIPGHVKKIVYPRSCKKNCISQVMYIPGQFVHAYVYVYVCTSECTCVYYVYPFSFTFIPVYIHTYTGIYMYSHFKFVCISQYMYVHLRSIFPSLSIKHAYSHTCISHLHTYIYPICFHICISHMYIPSMIVRHAYLQLVRYVYMLCIGIEKVRYLVIC
jgi:hypothetical protein